MDSAECRDALEYLRRQAIEQGVETLGSHQLDAHWSVAYACGQAPEAWELYRAAPLHLIPCTRFFLEHPGEIQDAIRPYATWDLLEEQATGKVSAARSVQFYDHTSERWGQIDVPAIDWFDAREIFREALEESSGELIEKVERNLENLRRLAAENTTPERVQRLEGYEKFVREGVPQRLARFEAAKEELRRKIQQLEATPDFSKALFQIVRAAENEVRASRGVAAVGESWISETELLYRVRSLFPNLEVLAHGRPRWLPRQHLDVWIPQLSLAIEYQGIQHFEPVEIFGGEAAFRRGQERDRRKRTLCEQRGVRLIEIAYDQEIDDAELETLIAGIE